MAPSESSPSATVTDLATARRSRQQKKDTTSTQPQHAAESARADAVTTTGKTVRKPANRRFDAEKVERLKAEIADGSYEVDPESVADRFIEHERNN